MNHIKVLSAVAFMFLLCGGLKAAQSELPCGVTLFFDYKTAKTNSAMTGRESLIQGGPSIPKYRRSVLSEQGTIQLGDEHSVLNRAVTTTYPDVWHYGGDDNTCPTPPALTNDFETGSIIATSCSATLNGSWGDMGNCYSAHGLLVQSAIFSPLLIEDDPPATAITNGYHLYWQENGNSYVLHSVQTLSNPYTLEELISNALGALTWPNAWTNGGASANITVLGGNNVCVKVRGLKYRLRYVGPKGESGTFRWIERFKPDNGGAFVDTVKEHEVKSFTGVEQTSEEYVINPPPSGGEVLVIPPPEAACSRCTLAQADFQNGSASFTFGLGSVLFGQTAGLLYVMENYPGAVHTRQSLKASTPMGLVDVVTNSGGLRQVKTPSALVDVNDIANGYSIDFYSGAGSKSGGLYPPSGILFASWTLVQISSSPYSVEVRQNGTATNTYTYQSGGWVWTRPDGTTESTSVITNATGDKLQVTRTIASSGGTPVFDRSVSNIVLSAGVVVPVMEILGAGSETMTNRWLYETNVASTHTNYGKLLMKIDAAGGWERYEYETNGLMLKRIVGFGNSGTNATESQSRVFEYNYAPVASEGSNNLAPTSPRTVVEKLEGYEIARAYYIYRPGTNVTIQCTRTNAPVDASDNLSTTNWVRPVSNGTIEVTRLPDGLHQISIMLTNSDATFQTNVFRSGVADSTGTNLVEGTITTTVTTNSGPVISRKTVAVPANVVTAHETYSDPDTYKRMRFTAFVLDGTSNYTTYAECCGQATFKDRDGVITSYTHDSRKRVLTTTHVGITTSNVYDAAGTVLETWRYGSNRPPIKLSSSTYDRAGRLKTSVDGMTNTTTYSYSFDAATGRSKTTITYPDGGTRIEYQNKDGTLSEIAGTAAVPLTYTYDIEAESGLHRAYTLETRSPSTEWVKKYTDMAGRTYKEVHSAASAPYPATESFYDNKGRLVKQIAFDSVTNLFIYNTLGEVEYSGIDMNADGQLTIASSDRLTRTVRDYSANGGVPFERLSTIACTTIGASDHITNSVSETSLDGLQSWHSGPGFTNRSLTVINSSAKTIMIYSTNADGAFSITTNVNGRITGVGQFAANGTLIGGTAYAYDDHGRQFKVVDGRTGMETVSLFNNADQVVTNIINAAGLPSQTTVNFYDSMGRVWRVTHPDGTSVTNEYYVTGLLKKTYGSRTYPVEYKYDVQGRMTNMTTWQNYPSGGAANTAWFYDGYRGWLTNKLDAAGKGPVYAYTPAGWLQSRGWARGTNTTYSYNAAGELTSIGYSDVTPDVTFTYDRRGRQTDITQGSATTTQVFNDAGQLLSQTANGLTVSNSYDLYFRRTNSGVWNGSAWLTRTEYTYDTASRLEKVGDGTNSATYAYLANSSLIDTITFKENAATRMTTTKTWDNFNRLKKIESVTGGTTVSSHTYAYNSANQRTSVTNADNARWVYEYDELGQVTSGKKYWADGTIVAGQQFEYDFDDIGNRKYAGSGGTEWGSNLRYANYTVNSLNQYSQRTVPSYVDVLGSANSNATVTVNDTPTYRKAEYFRAEVEAANGAGALWLSLTNLAVLQNGSNPDFVTNTIGNLFVPKNPETFTYDLDGNQTSDGRWTNRWDAENRLIAVESLSTTPDGAKRKLVFAYDWQGRRISKMVSNYVSGSWVLASNVRFVYDNWNLLAELNATNNVVINSYMWGLDLSDTEHGAGGVGGLLSINSTGNGTHFYSFDGSGNIATLISCTNGTVTAEYEYDPFLNPLRTTGPMVSFNSFTGSGKFWDSEIGCYYYGHRYYNASSGRWLSRDPMEERGALNLYLFTHNNAINYWDLLGLRDSGGFPVTGTGHHIIPVELWEEFGFPDEAKKIFDHATIDVKSYVDENGRQWKHDYTAHGKAGGYTGHVRDELVDILQRKRVAGKALTVEEYVDLSKDLVKRIRGSSNPFVSGFLKNVHDPKLLNQWVTTVGSTIPRPAGKTAVKFQGFRRIKVPRTVKCGRKVPIVKYLLLIGAAVVWEIDYNNARADGRGPAVAGTLATARAADPGFEMAWDFGWSIGTWMSPFD